jgi:hypothetical protein
VSCSLSVASARTRSWAAAFFLKALRERDRRIGVVAVARTWEVAGTRPEEAIWNLLESRRQVMEKRSEQLADGTRAVDEAIPAHDGTTVLRTRRWTLF